MEQSEARLSIGKETLEEVLRFLVTHPYNQVAGLIGKIQSDIKPIKENKDNME